MGKVNQLTKEAQSTRGIHFISAPSHIALILFFNFLIKNYFFCLTGRLGSKPHIPRIRRRICLSPRLKICPHGIRQSLRVLKLERETPQEHWRTKQVCPPQNPGRSDKVVLLQSHHKTPKQRPGQ